MQAHTTTEPRRTKVKGHPGVYYRSVGRRRRYEITYLEPDGRRRWQTIPGYDNLEDAADALRKAKTSKEWVAESKVTFGTAVDQWIAQLAVAERTRERYVSNVENHLRPKFGSKRVQKIDVDAVAAYLAELRRTKLAGWTQRNILTTLSSFMKWAKRRKLVAVNPCHELDRDERPKVRRRGGRTLQPDEITALLGSATTDRYKVMIGTAIFSGLRLMELLALRWQDVDFDASEIRVRHQLSRKGKRLVPLKSDAGERIVPLMPELAAILREHLIGSRYGAPDSYVFATETGGPMSWRNAERRAMDAAFAAAVKAKRIPISRTKPVLHDCRHTFGSLLIAAGEDVYSVSRAMGHSRVSTTLDTYAGEFDRVRNADSQRAEMSRRFGNLLETATRNQPQSSTPKTGSVSQLASRRN